MTPLKQVQTPADAARTDKSLVAERLTGGE